MPKLRVKRHAVTQPLDADYRLIPLTKNQNAIVDVADFNWLSKFNWCANWNKFTRSFYARRWRAKGKPRIWMHREILGCQPKERGDHKNHNTLDNRRRNLRKATAFQNNANRAKNRRNTTGYKGIQPFWNKWHAAIRVNHKAIHLGSFKSKEAAARAYDAAALKHFGEFAFLNFPQTRVVPYI